MLQMLQGVQFKCSKGRRQLIFIRNRINNKIDDSLQWTYKKQSIYDQKIKILIEN